MLKPKNIFRSICFISIFLFIFALQWQSPKVNNEVAEDIGNCLYKSNYKNLDLNSMERDFNISYIPNAPRNCVNPSFPIIHIKLKQEHNAWLQVVRTDCSDEKLQEFIDANVESQYPFYTLQQDFYDSPLWYYTLFSKPLTYWTAHTYAVKIDHQNKTIKIIGGIKWGFRLAYFPIKPQMILPSSLDTNDWQIDTEVFKQALVGYKID
ncbi:MAG: hypothetical protein LN567_01470 [Rickettsia endosymbiont of Graphium doson]|nr:hypothetical protein [Rickettsia endosymbiont of Graphium doson]